MLLILFLGFFYLATKMEDIKTIEYLIQSNPEKLLQILHKYTSHIPDKHNLSTDVVLKVIDDIKTHNIIYPTYELTEGSGLDMSCPKCNTRSVVYFEKQDRRADEGSSIYYICKNCRHQWKSV